MKMKIICCIFVVIMITINTHTMQQFPYEAVVIIPVTDLLIAPLSEISKNYAHGLTYEQIPIGGSPVACPRLHQLRANERVTVIEESGEEVKVKLPQYVCVLKMVRNYLNIGCQKKI